MRRGIPGRRWNTMAAGTIGVELQLMPMLLGFLTYKGSVIARGAADLFADLIAPAAPAGAPAAPSLCLPPAASPSAPD